MKNDTQQRYGSISRLCHWGMAVLIAWQLLKLFDRIADGEHWVGQTLVPWHISIGSLLLLLVVLRIAWWTRQRHNRPEQNPATAWLVKAGHFLLYAGMVLLPVTGVLYMVGGGYGWAPFGISLIPQGGEIPWMASVGSLHSPIAWLLLIMITGHMGIALWHLLIRKDGVMQRML